MKTISLILAALCLVPLCLTGIPAAENTFPVCAALRADARITVIVLSLNYDIISRFIIEPVEGVGAEKVSRELWDGKDSTGCLVSGGKHMLLLLLKYPDGQKERKSFIIE